MDMLDITAKSKGDVVCIYGLKENRGSLFKIQVLIANSVALEFTC